MICLLPEKVQEFKQALKNKEINIADLINMSTEERTTLLGKYAGSNAKDVNTLFEEKLVLKNKIQGLKNWSSRLGKIGKYSDQGKADLDAEISKYRAAQQQRIFNPKEEQSFLNDLADKKVGVHISKEVAQKVFQLSSELSELKAKDTGVFGVSDEYLAKKAELNAFVEAQTPLSVGSSLFKNLTTIGRDFLLFNPSTPLKTSIGQIINSTMEAAARRLSNLSLSGSSSKLASEANKSAWETFKKTGLNTAGMEGLDDTHIMNKGENFKVPTGDAIGGKVGKGVETLVRKTAQAVNKAVIDWAHVGPFTKFYQKTFFDTANILADKIAQEEGLAGDAVSTRANEIFKDAIRIEPKTPEGAMLRLRAQEQSARITSTNDTWASKITLGLKAGFNKGIPGLGDIIAPIAKIPANLIANSIDNAGGGIPKGVYDIVKGREKIQSNDMETRYEGMAQFANGIQHLIRIAGSLSVAALLASRLTKDSFRSDNYGNHFVKIGNIWVNMEYVAAISASLAGFMYAKEYGSSALSNVLEYGIGTVSGLSNLPVVNEGSNLIAAATNKDPAKGILKYLGTFFNSRGEPAFIKNLLSGRPIERLFFGATGVETTKEVAEDNAAKSAKAAASRKKN